MSCDVEVLTTFRVGDADWLTLLIEESALLADCEAFSPVDLSSLTEAEFTANRIIPVSPTSRITKLFSLGEIVVVGDATDGWLRILLEATDLTTAGVYEFLVRLTFGTSRGPTSWPKLSADSPDLPRFEVMAAL